MEQRDPLEGIAAADAHLGRPVPLPAIVLPLTRWVEIVAVGDGAVQVEWNLDATRPETPGRLTLYAGAEAPRPSAAFPRRRSTAATRTARHRWWRPSPSCAR